MSSYCSISFAFLYSLLKKLDAQESITALAFSHDGGALVAGTETGHVLQVNIRSTDASGQPIAVDPTGGKIGGLALVAESSAVSFVMPFNASSDGP